MHLNQSHFINSKEHKATNASVLKRSANILKAYLKSRTPYHMAIDSEKFHVPKQSTIEDGSHHDIVSVSVFSFFNKNFDL